jgi:hypothetical protein
MNIWQCQCRGKFANAISLQQQGKLQEPCEFPESANILSLTSVYINEELSKPTTSVCT